MIGLNEMTDEEMAEEWVKGHCDDSLYSFRGQELKGAFIAGLKAGSQLDRVWHDYDAGEDCYEDSHEGRWIKREAGNPDKEIVVGRGNGKGQTCLKALVKQELIKSASTEALLKELKWTDLEIGDVIRHKKIDDYQYMITGICSSDNTKSHILIGGSWMTDSELSEYWEKEVDHDKDTDSTEV